MNRILVIIVIVFVLVLAVSITIGQIGIGRQNSRYGTRAPQGGVSLSRFVRLEKRVATLETEPALNFI